MLSYSARHKTRNVYLIVEMVGSFRMCRKTRTEPTTSLFRFIRELLRRIFLVGSNISQQWLYFDKKVHLLLLTNVRSACYESIALYQCRNWLKAKSREIIPRSRIRFWSISLYCLKQKKKKKKDVLSSNALFVSTAIEDTKI